MPHGFLDSSALNKTDSFCQSSKARARRGTKAIVDSLTRRSRLSARRVDVESSAALVNSILNSVHTEVTNRIEQIDNDAYETRVEQQNMSIAALKDKDAIRAKKAHDYRQIAKDLRDYLRQSSFVVSPSVCRQKVEMCDDSILNIESLYCPRCKVCDGFFDAAAVTIQTVYTKKLKSSLLSSSISPISSRPQSVNVDISSLMNSETRQSGSFRPNTTPTYYHRETPDLSLTNSPHDQKLTTISDHNEIPCKTPENHMEEHIEQYQFNSNNINNNCYVTVEDVRQANLKKLTGGVYSPANMTFLLRKQQENPVKYIRYKEVRYKQPIRSYEYCSMSNQVVFNCCGVQMHWPCFICFLNQNNVFDWCPYCTKTWSIKVIEQVE